MHIYGNKIKNASSWWIVFFLFGRYLIAYESGNILCMFWYSGFYEEYSKQTKPNKKKKWKQNQTQNSIPYL